MEDMEVLLQSSIKLEYDVKQEQNIHGDFSEECSESKPSEQLESLELPVKEETESDMEELKPPIAVWILEEPEIYAGEEEQDLCAQRDGSFHDPLLIVKKDESLVHTQGIKHQDKIEIQKPPDDIHSQLESQREENTFACSMCKMKISQGVYLADHLQSHSGGVQYACATCEKKIRIKTSLTRHILHDFVS